MMKNNKIQKAKEFATKKHNGQKRKFGGEDYIVHPEFVANLVSDYTNDEDVISAAFLHDTLEDTNTNYSELKQEFGDKVARLVYELTSPSKEHRQLSRYKRKEMDRNHLSSISSDAQTIKYADIYHNVPSMVKNDYEFGKIYVEEKWADMQVMDKGNSTLRNIIINMLSKFRELYAKKQK